jgi:hypothetical protein
MNMKFISLVRQDFLKYFHSCFTLVKILYQERECDTTRAHGEARTRAARAVTRRCYHETKRFGPAELVSINHPYIPNPVTLPPPQIPPTTV